LEGEEYPGLETNLFKAAVSKVRIAMMMPTSDMEIVHEEEWQIPFASVWHL